MALVPPHEMPNRSLRVEVLYRDKRWILRRVSIVNGRAAPAIQIAAFDRDEPVSGFVVEVQTADKLWYRAMKNPVRQHIESPDPRRRSFMNVRAVPLETSFTMLVPFFGGDEPTRLRILCPPLLGRASFGTSEPVLEVELFKEQGDRDENETTGSNLQ